MKCPKCEHRENKVIDSREVREGASIRRRRLCLNCGHRFTTYEEVLRAEPHGQREPGERLERDVGREIRRGRPVVLEVEIAALLDGIDTFVEELAIELRATQPDSTGVEDLAIGLDETQPETAQPQAQNAWQGMPEFNQPDGGPFRTIKVHCKDQAAVNAFAKLIGQKLTDKTKWVWYPEVVKVAAAVVYA